MYDETPTPYVKPSRKATPPKADHTHEYVRPFTVVATFRGNTYRLFLPVACVVCGWTKRRGARDVVEIEISFSEYRSLKA